MTYPPDPRIEDARLIPMADVIDRLGIEGLRVAGQERVGPCPVCGGDDRFAINLRSKLFQCRKCGIKGGDQIALAREVLGLDFRGALAFLCGDAPAQIDPAAMERRRAAARAREAREARAQERFRQQAISDARRIWSRAEGQGRVTMRHYLAARGLKPHMLPDLPNVLRCLPDHPYVRRIGGQLVTLHRGPCMVAAIQGANRKLMAVHQTWINPEAPFGKAEIRHEGENFPAKLVRGSKKGGAIRLCNPRNAQVLIMGEGIETTLTALAAAPVPGAAYWAGVDLGNMAGRMQRIEGARDSGLPDMADDRAFVPPPWIRRLIFIQDGDSDPNATRAKLESGLRRAMALVPGLQGQIVHAGQGVDLNDVLNAGVA